ALSEADQMKLATKQSLKEFHSSHVSGLGDGVDLQSKDEEEDDEHDNDKDDNDDHDSDDDNDDNDDEDQNQEDEDYAMGGEQEDEEDEELYSDLNINLNRRDAKMTDAQVNQETGEVHVTLTTEPPVVQQQNSSVSSNLVSKFINPSPNTSIDSILNPNVQSDIHVNVLASATTETPFSNTTIPQSPILIIQPQQQTLASTTTITIPT
ncbi:hypothetical protein Tco_1308887, partial [Tanacetum coccineum]